MEKIIDLMIQIGLGSAIGVIIGIVFQYFFSKKLIKFEEKLSIFRKLYWQLYYVALMTKQDINSLDKNTGIDATSTMHQSGLDITKALGDALYYADKNLEDMIGSLIYNIYQEDCILGKTDIQNIEKILKELKSMNH